MQIFIMIGIFPDNPYDTADKWLLKENLPLAYRQQIVEFILQNSGQGGVALDSSFRDPFTGGKYNFILVWYMKLSLTGKMCSHSCFLVM